MELEDIKTSGRKDEEVKAQARNVVRLLDQQWEKTVLIDDTPDTEIIACMALLHLDDSMDNRIIAGAMLMQEKGEDIQFVTDDLCCRHIARSIGLNTASIQSEVNPNTGYTVVTLSDDELADFYSDLSSNRFGLRRNEYLIVQNSDGDVVDKRKWNGEMYEVIKYKRITNDFIGKVEPRNLQQELCFDMLQDQSIAVKAITGGFGVGKDFIMLSHAIHYVLKSQKFDKVIWVRNNVEVKNSRQIGFLPGSMNEKLMPFAQIIADHVGGQMQLESFINQGKIELCHLGFLRGRDIKNAIVYCSEAENLTKEHIQLLLGRIGEGSQLWMNGDYKQVDADIFRVNNGLQKAITTLSGNPNFGFVKLQKTERSKVAMLADLLD